MGARSKLFYHYRGRGGGRGSLGGTYRQERASSDLMQALLSNLEAYLIIFDSEGNFLEISNKASHLIGISKKDIIQLGFRDITPARYINQLPGQIKALLEQGKVEVLMTVEDRNGQEIVVRCQMVAHILPEKHLASWTVVSDEEAENRKIIDILSAREKEILLGLSNGHDYKSLGSHLGISPETARQHVRSAKLKLGAKTRTEAVALFLTAPDS